MDITILYRTYEDLAAYLTEAASADLRGRCRSGETGVELYGRLMGQQRDVLPHLDGRRRTRGSESEPRPDLDHEATGALIDSQDCGDILAREFRATAREVERAFSSSATRDAEDVYARHIRAVSGATRRLADLLGLE